MSHFFCPSPEASCKASPQQWFKIVTYLFLFFLSFLKGGASFSINLFAECQEQNTDARYVCVVVSNFKKYLTFVKRCYLTL